MPDGTWITISGITGTTSDDGVSLNGRNFKISNPAQDPDTFSLNEFESIDGGLAGVSSYVINIDFVPIIPGSVQINVGTLQFIDSNLDGVLSCSDGTSIGLINYSTGQGTLTFTPNLGSPTEVYIRVVSYNEMQDVVAVNLTGSYTGGGLIAKISNFDIQTKVFNFFGDDQRSRLSKIDFYTNQTGSGQFTCNVLGDSSDVIINTPLKDNLQSNVVLTFPNQYQVAGKDDGQTIYRLYCDATAQTVQLELNLSDRQMAVDVINSEKVELLAMMFSMRRGGRLI
jgi:hypothetical protein